MHGRRALRDGCANGLVEGVLREVARALRAVHDIVEVDRKVEREPEARGVCRRERRERMPVRELVRLQRDPSLFLLRVDPRQLGEVSVLVSAPGVRQCAVAIGGENVSIVESEARRERGALGKQLRRRTFSDRRPFPHRRLRRE